MGIFSLMDSFFFISLGITFILILLLVYHFKQRLTAVERKTDTMVDIMNNIVKEIASIRGFVLSHQPMPVYHSVPQSSVFQLNNETVITNNHPTTIQPDDNDVDSDTDVESEMDVESECTSNSNEKIMISDDEDDDDDDLDEDDEDDEDDQDQHQETKQDSAINESEKNDDITNNDINLDSIDNATNINLEEITVSLNEEKNNNTEEVDINKMSLSQLKNHVTKLNLANDVSKLKKKQLLELLQ